ncbi:hypothetical protein AVEN_126857-1 [Araneus ventricosus]|uniref:Secreted protein n=1 Tax=Araneus ventricosus TaxID=182803 RepID=A0A4Y2C1H4_ARAVE|nr:hypothetical protein AVEN_126857-1 [Araneus ventricosus]
MHAWPRRGMLTIVSLTACCSSNVHSCSKACWSSWRVPGGTLRPANRLLNMSHTFSMVFRYGYLAGHAICGMVSLSRQLHTNRALCGRTLSSINIAPVPIAAIKGRTRGYRISSRYQTAVTEPPANT